MRLWLPEQKSSWNPIFWVLIRGFLWMTEAPRISASTCRWKWGCPSPAHAAWFMDDIWIRPWGLSKNDYSPLPILCLWWLLLLTSERSYWKKKSILYQTLGLLFHSRDLQIHLRRWNVNGYSMNKSLFTNKNDSTQVELRYLCMLILLVFPVDSAPYRGWFSGTSHSSGLGSDWDDINWFSAKVKKYPDVRPHRSGRQSHRTGQNWRDRPINLIWEANVQCATMSKTNAVREHSHVES